MTNKTTEKLASSANVSETVSSDSPDTSNAQGDTTMTGKSSSSQQRCGDDRRKSVVDRRSGLDRRDYAGENPTNLERRRGPGRRRTDFTRAAEEGEMSNEQFLFLLAIDAFKAVNNKTFPTWTDVLEVIRKLGYRKTMSSELDLGPRAEDWTERADAPSGVFKESDEEIEEPQE